MSDAQIQFINNLSYKLPQPSSVVTSRILKRMYFQNRGYKEGQTAVIQFSSGTEYIDCKNSSLVVKLKFNSAQDATDWAGGFGTGSAGNIIKNLRLYHRSGTSYCNVQRSNLYRKTIDRYTESDDWFRTIGVTMGYDIFSNQISGPPINEASTFVAVIPLDHVHDFFNPEGGVMLPPNMAAGMRMEIDFASLAEVFHLDQASTDAPTDYEIDDIYIDAMSVSLMDSASASVNTNASTKALSYVYRDFYTSQNSQSALNSVINIDVNKSVAFCDSAITVIQKQADVSNLDTDGMLTTYSPGLWEYQLGSVHYPNQKVDLNELAYKNALIAFDKYKMKDKKTAVTFADFLERTGSYSISLENDTSLALSQNPVNASRSLHYQCTLDTPPPDALIVTVFMSYLSAARTTLLNSRVDI